MAKGREINCHIKMLLLADLAKEPIKMYIIPLFIFIFLFTSYCDIEP